MRDWCFLYWTIQKKKIGYSQDKQYISQIQRARDQAVGDPGKILAQGGCCGMGESNRGAWSVLRSMWSGCTGDGGGVRDRRCGTWASSCDQERGHGATGSTDACKCESMAFQPRGWTLLIYNVGSKICEVYWHAVYPQFKPNTISTQCPSGEKPTFYSCWEECSQLP